jgi:hypothetical protein
MAVAIGVGLGVVFGFIMLIAVFVYRRWLVSCIITYVVSCQLNSGGFTRYYIILPIMMKVCILFLRLYVEIKLCHIEKTILKELSSFHLQTKLSKYLFSEHRHDHVTQWYNELGFRCTGNVNEHCTREIGLTARV